MIVGYDDDFNVKYKAREYDQWKTVGIDELILNYLDTRWISVTERLPEKHQYVLVTYNGLDGRRLVVVTNWNPNTWIESNSVAWMPVPEPYEGRQK